MSEKYFRYLRMFITGFASIGIIIVVAGVISDFSKTDVKIESKLSQPQVKFSDYKEFRNRPQLQTVKVSVSELIKEQEEFRNSFFQHFQVIYKNISGYSSALNQGNVDVNELEEYLFNLVSQYDAQLRITYLQELDSESEGLLEYAKELNKNRDNEVILWSEFLDWFSDDFKDQSRNVVTNKASNSMFLTIEMLIIFLLLLIILMLANFEIKNINAEGREDKKIKEEK